MTNHPNRSTIQFIRFENERSADRGRAYSCDHILEHKGDTYRVSVSSHITAHDIDEAKRMLRTYLAGVPKGSPISYRVSKIEQ